MQKETLISVLIGLTLGLFVTYGLYRLKQSITTAPDENSSPTVTPGVENPTQTSRIQLTSPQDGIIQTADTIEVSGTTSVPESYVVIFVGNDETILQADETGGFSLEVKLEDGANVITVVLVDEDGKVESTERLVAVTDVFEDSSAAAPEAETTEVAVDASPAAESTTDALLDRIQKNKDKFQDSDLIKTIEQLTVKRKAIMGRVTRVTDEAITLDSRQGSTILPIDENTNITKASKEIALSAIAVDDWALVMGKVDDNTVTPEYVMVSSQSLEPEPYLVALGSLSQIGKTSVTITNRADDQEMELTINKNTKYQDLDGKEASLSNFVTDLTVLAVGKEETITTLRALAVFEN